MITALAPVAQGVAASFDEIDNTVGGQLDAPVAVGGGSVTDGSDSSYMEIGTWYDDAISDAHVEIVTCDFVVPSGMIPTAMGLQLRVKSTDEVLASPPDGGARWWNVYTAVDDPTGDSLSGIGYGSFGVWDGIVNVYQDTIATLQTFSGPDLDMDNPTNAGNWCDLAPTADGGGTMWGAYEALTGAGLRISMFMQEYVPGAVSPTSRIPWVDLYEVRLLVASDGAPTGTQSLGMLRVYPRPSESRVFPPPQLVERSGRVGPSAIL